MLLYSFVRLVDLRCIRLLLCTTNADHASVDHALSLRPSVRCPSPAQDLRHKSLYPHNQFHQDLKTPLQIDYPSTINLGNNIFINNNLKCVARGGITIEDGVMIAPGVTILTVNHDLKDHCILIPIPVTIKKNAWEVQMLQFVQVL